jgi:hypothetical protein
MSDTKPLNLRQKLVAIYTEIDHIDKMGENTKQRYNFVRAADVMRPVRDAFAKYGIYAEPNFEYLGSYDIKTNNGGNMHTATVKATIVLHDTESDETMTISGLGDGADSGDKGIFKAQTGAVKNALRNGLLIPDEGDPNGGDPEGDENVDERTTGNYTHNSSTTEMPDFQDARHAEPKAGTAKPRPTHVEIESSVREAIAEVSPTPGLFGAPVDPSPKPSGTHVPFGTTGVDPNLVDPSPAPERGDAYEEPEVAKLPTEEEMVGYRARMTELANQLSTHGKLTASKGLKLNTKLLVFFLSITKAAAAKEVTVRGWEDFFARAAAAIENPKIGLIGLTQLINAANGIEPKQ